MRASIALLAAVGLLALTPQATAHGALTINEFDTYAISDFEGHEDSFPWEGWEIWDVYAGDGYSIAHGSHGVYFKANFAGDGTARPTGGQVWGLDFSYAVNGTQYQRSITHDGADVTSDFEELEWQIADGNVFQVRAWAAVPSWEGQTIEDLVVVSTVDGQPRDIAPGGFHDPATGAEVPFSAPSTVVFPPMGEGRIVETVPLTGPDKYLDVTVERQAEGGFHFVVENPLSAQGQHFLLQADDPAWTLDGSPDAVSIDGGQATEFTLQAEPTDPAAMTAPLAIHLTTDIGGRTTVYLYVDDGTVALTDDAELATTGSLQAPQVETPGIGAPLAGLVLLAVAFARRPTRR